MHSGKQKRILRKMGYLSDQEGVMNRFLEEGAGWDPHLQKTKKFILSFVEKVTPSTLAVLGSGWWLDLPVERLTRLCKNLVFVDVVHPPQIQHKAKKWANLQLLELDLAGGFIFEAYDLVKNYRKKHTVPAINEFNFSGVLEKIPADAYISLNILTQLDSLIVDFFAKHKIFQEPQLNDIRRKIQKSHLQCLPPGKACLITDYEEIQKDRQGKTVKNSLLKTHLPEGKLTEKWNWEFDLAGNYYPGKETTLKVIALEL